MPKPAGTLPATVYPTLSEAAEMIGVTASTLSRKPGLGFITAGDRDHRIPGAEVIRWAEHFKRRAVDEVAFDVVAYARRRAPKYVKAVTSEVDSAVAGLYAAAPATKTSAFIADAKRFLPKQLYDAVARAVLADSTESDSALPVASMRPIKHPAARGRSSKASRPSVKTRA
jgi:hypothetical protein